MTGAKRKGPALPINKPFCGRELKTIEYLLALDAKLADCGDAIRQRMQTIPGGWRDWRLMETLCRKILGSIYDTLPQKTAYDLDKLRAHGEILIRFEPASRSPEWLLIRDGDLKALVNTAVASECAVCMKEGKEIDRCRLRRAMIDVAPPHDDYEVGCGYRAVAAQCDYGKYI